MTRALRRAASITLYGSAALLITVGMPLLVPLAAAVDLGRGDRRWPTVRCLLFVAVYLLCESLGILAAAGLWLRGGWQRGSPTAAAAPADGWLADAWTGRPAVYLAANFRLQRWWARTIFGAAQRLFSMRTAIDGDEAVRRGPFVLFVRHASIGDTVLPAVFIGDRHGIMLRYIMKRELLWDPCLDIVGNRLPNCFVRRGSGESAREITAVQRLMQQLGPREAVLIYPEGTRFLPEKRDRVVARLAGAAPPRLLAMARSLRHVLPPRLGGALGLLAANRGADAVFCAHTGFEGAGSFRALLKGSLIDQTVRIRFWRVPFAQIPIDETRRAEWLFEQWLQIDAWIDAQRTAHQPARLQVSAARA
ncbi:MAG: 1-acyl-sn-glycerol-3-phosphate acyltransferase [Candidatus Binatia bacterium]